MHRRPQPSVGLGIDTLHGWYAVTWILLGLCPPIIAVLDVSGPTRYLTVAVAVLLGAAYGIVRWRPENRPLRPTAYLCLLVVALGVLAYLSGGGAALFVVTLPQFWFFARDPRRAITFSTVAAIATVVGGTVDQGWSPDFRTGNVAATLIALAASVLLGLWLHRLVSNSDERAWRLSVELDTAKQQLAEAHRREGAEEERLRLAREIHDTVAQGLASIVVLAEAARTSVYSDTAKSTQQLLAIESTARDNLAEARVLVGAAPHSSVAPGSVAQTLSRTLARFAEHSGVNVSALLPDIECDQTTRIALLRCTQESLANVSKHAGASSVGVVLVQHAQDLELEITDDGRGFVVSDARGFGLDGMRRRLDELGGELIVTSSPGDGTRVLARIPVDGSVSHY